MEREHLNLSQHCAGTTNQELSCGRDDEQVNALFLYPRSRGSRGGVTSAIVLPQSREPRNITSFTNALL